MKRTAWQIDVEYDMLDPEYREVYAHAERMLQNPDYVEALAAAEARAKS